MVESLPDPDFSYVLVEQNLLFEVTKEMHQTNFLKDYHARTERCAMIIEKMIERSKQLSKV